MKRKVVNLQGCGSSLIPGFGGRRRVWPVCEVDEIIGFDRFKNENKDHSMKGG